MSTGDPIPTGITPEAAPKIPQTPPPGSSPAETQVRQGLIGNLTSEISTDGVDSALDKLAGKDSWGTAEPIGTTGTKTENTETSKNPDREILIRALEERTEGFFGMARVRSGRITEAAESTQRAHRDLEEIPDNGRRINGRVRDIPDPRAEEVSDLIGQTARRAEEQMEDAQNTMRSLGIDDQLSFIHQQGNEFTGGGMEQYKQELRDALKIEDPAERSAMLQELKGRIIAVAQRVDQDAARSANDTIGFDERTKQRTSSAPGRLSDARDMAPRLKEKLGDSYPRILSNIEDMAESFSRFRRSGEHIDSLRLEFRLLSNAANELGMSVSQIFAAFEKGEFS